MKLPLHAVKNIELVQSLGANQVIDYNEENFEDVLHNFDIAYDLLGDTFHTIQLINAARF